MRYEAHHRSDATPAYCLPQEALRACYHHYVACGSHGVRRKADAGGCEQDVAKVVKNVARVLQVADRLDVPFYLGADEPLLGDVIDAAYVSLPACVCCVAACEVMPKRRGPVRTGLPAGNVNAARGLVSSVGLHDAVSWAGRAGGCACNTSSTGVNLPLSSARNSSSEACRGRQLPLPITSASTQPCMRLETDANFSPSIEIAPLFTSSCLCRRHASPEESL